MQFIDLQAQYKHLKERIDARIHGVLDHGKYILGPEVAELEERLSAYTGAQYVTGVANGTDALQLALMALEVGPGDAVFTTTFTFFATAEVISLVGAEPIFVDIDPRTYNICPRRLAEAVQEVVAEGRYRPKAIIAVDLFGLPADYDAITAVAREHQLAIIEDAAQGFGGCLGDRRAGNFGDIATTSFFPAKPLGCYGDGGAIFTNRQDLHERVRSLYVHGKGTDKYDNVRIGMNSRLDTIQAAILLEKLANFPWELDRRQEVAAAYGERLGDAFLLPYVPPGYLSSWAQYTIQHRSGERQRFMDKLSARGIPTAIYYGRNMHEQTAYADVKVRQGELAEAERAARAVFSLPMHPYMTTEEIDRVAEALLD